MSGATTADFVYNGDGERVKGTVNGVTTAYVGNYFEWTGGAMVKYYYAGGQRVAMKQGGVVRFLLGDHLGSTTITATDTGGFYSELRYKAWGGERYSSATETPTTFRFTGQRAEELLGGADGLYYYNARWYDPYLAHFVQPDSIIPDQNDPQSWDRFAYTLNNPVRFKDPSGHKAEEDEDSPPPITYDKENGLCINIIGCSGGKSYWDWYENEYMPLWPYLLDENLTEISNVTQDAATFTSSVGAAMELGGIAGGGFAGAMIGNELHQKFTNPVETALSFISTAATVVDDIIAKNTQIDASGNIVLGEASATSLAGFFAGAVTPIGIIDAVIDGYLSSYNRGLAPGIYGLLGITSE